MINIGQTDRLIRVIIGAALIAVAWVPGLADLLAGLGNFRPLIAIVGFVLVITAAVRICPAYRLLGIRTCPLPDRKA